MKVRVAVGLLAVVAGAVALVPSPSSVRAASPTVFVVNSTGDGDDAAADGVCATSTGACTLRAAMTEAAAVTSAPVVINFAIPGTGVHRIDVPRRLPLVDNGKAGITIDGFSQPGSSANTDPLVDNATRTIELVGTGASGVEGLIVLGSNNVIRGLVMHRFMRAIRITGSAATANQVVGNTIGLNPDGTLDSTYASIIGSPCIDINNGAFQNKIGMPGIANRNVISGCYEKGVTLYNQFTWKNYIQNNLIGLDPTGTANRGNGSMGIDINWSANGTIVGGTAFQERNVISGNHNSGIEISHGTGTINNHVAGNFIGTDPTGNSASPATVNNDLGVRLEGKPDCGTKACPVDAGNETVTDNVIVNSGWGGIMVDKGVHDSQIQRNRIGVTLDGTVVGNSSFGIRLAAGATHITIGPGNLIAGKQPGIQINPLGFDPASNVPTPTQYNTITQNSITTTSGLGIDILPYGVVNQNGNGDPTVNQGVDVPVLAMRSGQVAATTCASCVVEVFGTTGAVGAFGPGATFLVSGTADSTGAIAFAAPAGGWPATVTATTTTPQGSTSEFAANIRAAAATAPGAPTALTATAGSGSAQVSFAPAPDNGSPVTSYTVTANDQTSPASGGQQASGATSPITIAGLTNGHSYTFTATATNAVGTGPSSAPSNAVTPTAAGGVAVTSLVPNVLGQGASWRTVKINGSGFASGATAAISGTGVTVKSLTVTSATLLTAMISVDPTAALGARDVTVNSGGGTATCAGCFSVNPSPTFTSATPSTITQGQTNVPVDIVGANFASGIKVAVSGAGITVGTVTRSDASHLRVILSATSTADLGGRSVTLTNPDAGNTTTAAAITVAAP